jgi:hypothetical protein
LSNLDIGPSSFIISFMFSMSDLFTAPMSETEIMYIVRKAMAPRRSSVQLGSGSCVRMRCVT